MGKKILAIAMALAMIVVLALPMGVSAAPSDGTLITGTLGSSITVVAPTDISFSTFAVGLNSGNATDGTVSVTGSAAWHVTATDLTNGGYMKNGGTALTNKLTMCDTSDGTFVNADTNLTYNSAPTTLAIYVKQTVAAGDPAGTYTATITFTGTVD